MNQSNAARSPWNPLVLEQELVSRLKDAGVYSAGELRLRVFGRKVLIDGFISDVERKSVVEQVCREGAGRLAVVNRLRVARSDDDPVE